MRLKLAALTLCVVFSCILGHSQTKQPPATRISDVIDTVGGITVHDPYRWLEGNTPEVQAWVGEQTAYSRSFLDKIDARDPVRARLHELFNLGMVTTPNPRRGHYFFLERKRGQELGVLYVQDGLKSAPRVLIDQNTLSPDQKTVIAQWEPSEDGTLLAYELSRAGNDRKSIHVFNVASGKDLADEIPETGYPDFAAWSHDGSGFWYIGRDPNAPANGEDKLYRRVFYHKLGSSSSDPVIFGNGRDKTDYLTALVSDDGRWLLVTDYISTGDKPRGELYLLDLYKPGSKFETVVKGPDALFGVEFHRGILYVLTNYGAPHWKIMSVAVEHATEGPSHWTTIIPEGEGIIGSFRTVRDRLFVESLQDIHSVLRECALDGSRCPEVPLTSLGTLDDVSGEDEGDEIFFGLTSFVVPHDIYRMELGSGAVSLFKKADGGIDKADFTVEQKWFRSKDGTKVPMFIIFKKGMKRNGSNPTTLYGYGGFNIPMTPVFAKTTIPFIEAGGVYAVANLRGGSEFGEQWHEGGMQKNKQHTFDDFIAAAEFLIAQKYTSKSRLAIFGWSNGGLSAGACLIQRPDLYKAVVMGNPILDMLRYQLFDGGPYWVPEYGSAEEPDMVPYLLRYSPYHNVKKGTKYPATLILTSDDDDRVHVGDAYKMTARLQNANASKNPILLRVETKAGHAGAIAVTAVTQQYADIWGFIFWQLGMSSMKQ